MFIGVHSWLFQAYQIANSLSDVGRLQTGRNGSFCAYYSGAMNESVPPPPPPLLKRRRFSHFLWVGFVLFLLGTGPLLAVIILASLGLTRDPNPNPVGFGILAFFTFWPSIILMVVGIVRTVSMRKAVAAGLLFAALTAAAQTQSTPDGFDPNADGIVRVMVVQPDKKILLAGDLTGLSPNGGAPVVRNHIARLNADGTLDTAFNPNANDRIYAIALQPDGKVLVGGIFTQIGGQVRQRVARLDATTGAADSFDPTANSDVYSIVVQRDGKLLLGGLFTNVAGVSRDYMARLEPVTGQADSFNPQINATVVELVLQEDGNILVGGVFSRIGKKPRNHLARIDPVTGLADSFDPNADNVVFAIALQADGKILAGGHFTTIGGQTRNNIARLDPATGLADSFDPNSNGDLASIAVEADGKIVVGGFFSDHGTGLISIGGQPRNNVARLDPATGLADSFNPGPNGGVHSIALQGDGGILIAGWFTTLRSNAATVVTRNHIARLVESDGTRCAQCARSRSRSADF